MSRVGSRQSVRGAAAEETAGRQSRVTPVKSPMHDAADLLTSPNGGEGAAGEDPNEALERDAFNQEVLSMQARETHDFN